MSSDQITVIPVENKKTWNTFVRFPYRHYRHDPNWVPQLLMDQKVLLNPEKHPFYEHAAAQFFLAFKGGKAVGRIAGIVDDKHIETHKEKVGFFGFFESIEEYEVTAKLLDAVKAWVKSKGMIALRGPLNPSQNEDCGMLIDDFNGPPVIMMPYNPPYYPEFMERYGLKKKMDLLAYLIDSTKKEIPEKLIRVAEGLRKRYNITVRPISMKDFDNEANKVWHIYNDAWSDNFGFVPMTKAEFDHLAKNLKSVIIPEIALMAEVDGKPVGFSLSLPDMNQALIHTNGRLLPFGILKLLYYSKKIDLARIIIMGVIHEFRNRGVDGIFYLDTWRNAVKKGMPKGEMSWILENNTMMNRAAKMLGGEVYRTYRLYQQKI